MNKLATLYLELAENVAGRNQFTCLAFVRGYDHRLGNEKTLRFKLDAKYEYAHSVGAVGLKRRVQAEHHWWNATPHLYVWNDREAKAIWKYAHNARVIALLFAHEMAKSGDIVLAD